MRGTNSPTGLRAHEHHRENAQSILGLGLWQLFETRPAPNSMYESDARSEHTDLAAFEAILHLLRPNEVRYCAMSCNSLFARLPPQPFPGDEVAVIGKQTRPV